MSGEVHCPTCAALNARAEANNWPTRCDGTLGFERDELRALLGIWRSKAENGVPTRTAFDMRTLQPVAPHVLIVEREGEGEKRRYKFRLFGSAMAMLFGEHTGRYLDEMVSSEMLPSWNAIYDAVLETQRPMRVVTQFRLPSEQPLSGEILIAPMADETGRVRLVLAATFVSPKDVLFPPSGVKPAS